jgi:hypothetical protein
LCHLVGFLADSPAHFSVAVFLFRLHREILPRKHVKSAHSELPVKDYLYYSSSVFITAPRRCEDLRKGSKEDQRMVAYRCSVFEVRQ